jgi:hypothetical protein
MFWGLVVSASILHSGDAAAQKRIALVIGNSNYINVRPLANPENDATAIAALFRAAGFDVVDAINNLPGTEMRRAFRDFAEKSRTADIAVVFFAGHGIEIEGTNYLLPVDTSLKRDIDVEDEAVSLDRIVRILEPAKRLRLIILDACRDNPFVRTVRRTSETRSVGRGLAKIEPTSSDTLIAFAARAGSTAADGDGKHSPFTTALLKNLTTPGLDLRIALGRVRDDVMNLTGRQQEPFVYGSLGGTTVTLLPEPKLASASSTAPSAATRLAPIVDPNAIMRHDYELAAQVGTKESWDAFLELYGTGFYADLARAQRSKFNSTGNVAMRTAPPTTTPSPPPVPPKPSVAALPPPPPTPPASAPPKPSVTAASVATAASPAPSPPATPPAAADPPKMVLSSLEPVSQPEAPAKAGPDLSETAKKVHAELARLGCYHGAADGSWGSDSRHAIEQFNKHASQKLDTKVASLDMLDVLSAKPTRVCPLQCKSGYRAESEACVKIVCKAGFVVGDDNECEREHERAHERKPRTKSASSESKKSSPKRDSNATSNMMMMRSRAWQH